MLKMLFQAAVLVGATVLTACQRAEQVDQSICRPVSEWKQPEKSPSDGVGYRDQAERCINRMAYKLSVASGSNSEIAEAAVLACDSEISLIQASTGKNGQNISEAQELSIAVLANADKADYQKSALLWVVQARAGHCAQLAKDLK